MSKKINEISNLAKTFAIYVATRAALSNSDKIKKALGFKDADPASDAAMRDLKKAQDKLAKQFEKKLKKMDPEKRDRILKRGEKIRKIAGME